jgi:methylenetetrahydrofolate reductase (NADPH)
MYTNNISFEFFPPKTPKGTEKLLKSAQRLAALSPEFFSITFGAGGSTREGTRETVDLLRGAFAIPIVPHLACVGLSLAEVDNILQNYQAQGIKRIIALRGDLPSGMGQSGELQYASELVKLIRDKTQDYFHIDVAAYPEAHPQCGNIQNDILNLKRKLDAGANGAITQYFFNADAYFYFLDACAKENIFMPIVPGIMPILQYGKLSRFSKQCGAEIPQWLSKRLESYADDQASIKAFGLEVIYDLCQRLIAGGAPGLHVYTLNQAEMSLNLFNLLNKNTHQVVPTQVGAHTTY